MSTSWKEFVETIEAYGFTILVRRRFTHAFNLEEQSVYPEFIIAAHRRKHLLLRATSWLYNDKSFGETLYGGSVWGTFKRRSDLMRSPFSGCSYSMAQFGAYEFEYEFHNNDVTAKLDELGQGGTFVKWNNPSRFLWLMDYTQNKENDGNEWKRHRDEFLAKAPRWVRGFILPDWRHRRLLQQKQDAKKGKNRSILAL